MSRARESLRLGGVALTAALAGGVAGALLYASFLDDGGGDQRRGGIVTFGGPDGFSRIDEEPFCVPAQHFCLVKLDSGEFTALYTYDTHAPSRSRTARCSGCLSSPSWTLLPVKTSRAGSAPAAAARPTA